MKAFHSIALGVAALFSMALPSMAARAHDDCPDVRASQVDASTHSLGETQRCGIGISIFGFGGGLFGPSCPDKKATYPSHQECLGEENPHTLCLPEGQMPVTLEDCECSRATVLGTGLLLPSCSCANAQDVGHIEDAKTEACPLTTIYDPGTPF